MKKIFLFVVAILILYFGVALCYKVDVGVGPNDALFLTLSKISLVKVGTISMIGSFIYFLLQVVILKRDFKKNEVLQIMLILISGFILNFFLYQLLKNFEIKNYILRVLLYIVSVFIKSIGVLIILNSGVAKTPLEGLADAIALKLNKKMGFVRQFFDVIFIVVVILLSIIFKEKITIGVGTVIDMVLFGPLLELLKKPFQKKKLKEHINERINIQ